LARYRPLVARKFDGSLARRVTDRPRIDRDVEQLIIRKGRENRSWGYDRIVGPLPILDTMSPIRRSATGCAVTVYRRRRNANVRSPGRNSSGLALLAATDFFTVEVLTLRGLATNYALFFIHLESRRVDVAGITAHLDRPWMEQMARNVTMDGWASTAA
jgi:putative transposase